jgi:hypothetical protein
MRYLRALFGSAWGTAFLIAGFISTIMTFVAIYVPEFHLPRWIPIGIAVAAFLFAPLRLYVQMEKRLAALQSSIQPPRKAELVLKPDGTGLYLRVVDDHTNRKVIALYLEPRVTVENKGIRNAVIESYDVSFPDLPEIPLQTNIKPHPLENTFVPALNANHGLGGGNDYVRSYVDVPAEKLVGPLRIPFLIHGSIPPPLYEKDRNLQCSLTVRDTEGNTASALVNLYQKG